MGWWSCEPPQCAPTRADMHAFMLQQVPTVKILVSFLVVQASLGSYPIPWPPSVRALWAGFSSGSSIPIGAQFVACTLK